MAENAKRKSSFYVENESKEKQKMTTDFIFLPKSIKNRKALSTMHSFRIANDKLFKKRVQYLYDSLNSKIYKLERWSNLNSCFVNNDLISLTKMIIISETHPCFVFAEALLIESEMIKHYSSDEQLKHNFSSIFQGNILYLFL